MKKLFYLLFFVIFCTAVKVSAQDLDCKKFKNGTFKSSHDGVDMLIKRQGSLQQEYIEGEKTPAAEFVIKWLNDCTYTMALDDKVLKDNPGIPKNGLLTVKINKVTGDTYSYSCSSNFSDIVINGEMTKVK